MSIDTFAVGHEFVVLIGSVEYPFNTIDQGASVNTVPRANSKYSPGYAVKKAGIANYRVTGVGPYDKGEITLTVGQVYRVMVKRYGVHLGKEANMILADVRWNASQEGGESNVEVTFENEREFDKTFN